MIHLVPVSLREAMSFVAQHHRHHRAPRGGIFSLAIACPENGIVAIAIVGRPVSRRLADGWTAEVTRVCVLEGIRNGCSMLYGAAWRAARAMGYRKIVTYTLAEEGGTSLRASGWRNLGEAGGGSWDRKARPRVDMHPTQRKFRWEAVVGGGGGMRFAYADPPYVGRSSYYKNHPDCAGEVDHAALVARLVADYPDGWALSLSSPSLRQILPLCPERTRVMAWVKPFASFKPGINPAYAWEPILVLGGRKRGRDVLTVRDWVSANITLRKGLCGVKPPEVCAWLFDVLGAEKADTLDDLFPGSGAVSRAWASR